MKLIIEKMEGHYPPSLMHTITADEKDKTALDAARKQAADYVKVHNGAAGTPPAYHLEVREEK